MSDKISLLDLKGSEAETVWRLAHGLDLQIGDSQCSGSTVESTMEQVGPWILQHLNARGLALSLRESPDTAAEANTFFTGSDRSVLDTLLRQCQEPYLSDVQQAPVLAAIPITLGDYPIGTLALSFDTAPVAPGAIVLLEVIGQELNNLFYEFRRARIRHRQVLELGKRLQNRVLNEAIDDAVAYIFEQVALEGLTIAYWEDRQENAQLRIRTYRQGQLIHKAYRGDSSPLGQIFAAGMPPRIMDIFDCVDIPGEPLGPIAIDIGLRDRAHPGIVCATATTPDHQADHLELLEQLANALGQRLVDYHKDRRYLQTYFSPNQVSQLLSVAHYQETYLSPRLQNIAMLYTDITSFTAISEQILSTPHEVGELIDYWSKGVMQILYDYQGVFDKMVGDCVIGLFGPPFYQDSDVVTLTRAIQAAIAIRSYTANLVGPIVDKIRHSDLIPGFGVATGVSFGSVMVGTFGPNHDFTAFGQEMNNTARLQGVAGFQEILVMEQAYGILNRMPSEVFNLGAWSDRLEAKVKNVRDPLYFRRLDPAS